MPSHFISHEQPTQPAALDSQSSTMALVVANPPLMLRPRPVVMYCSQRALVSAAVWLRKPGHDVGLAPPLSPFVNHVSAVCNPSCVMSAAE